MFIKHKSFVMTLISKIVFLFICLQFTSVNAANEVGQARLVIGPVSLESTVSASKILVIGDHLFQDDQVSTPANGYAVITLVDETKFTIKPNSVFKFTDVQDGADGVVLTELLKGGLKSITGSIGAQNPSGFKIKTPLGSIGIRGTNLGAQLCDNSNNCGRLHEALGCSTDPPKLTKGLLYVTVTQGTAYFDDCDNDPDIKPGQVGITDGTASGCKVLDEVPCFLEGYNWEQEQQKDQTLRSLEVPVIQDSFEGSFCQGDPICIQCQGDPNCIQCQGDPDCMQCQGDPICIQCQGDPLCMQCQGDPLCMQCNAEAQCIQCLGDQVCLQCMGDPVCLICQGDQICINQMNNPPSEMNPSNPEMPVDPCLIDPTGPTCPIVCNPGDVDCICMMDPQNPICTPEPPMCDPSDIECICLMDPTNTICTPEPPMCDPSDIACICMMDPDNTICFTDPPSECAPDDFNCICNIDPMDPNC